jgi:hypothetical protein
MPTSFKPLVLPKVHLPDPGAALFRPVSPLAGPEAHPDGGSPLTPAQPLLPVAHEHSSPGAPVVSVERENGVITRIRVRCQCGAGIELACEY